MTTSLINSTVLPFSATAYHNGKDIKVSEANLKGKWNVVFFYPADFTFVCPTELEDLAATMRIQETRRGFIRFRPDTISRTRRRHDHSLAIKKSVFQ